MDVQCLIEELEPSCDLFSVAPPISHHLLRNCLSFRLIGLSQKVQLDFLFLLYATLCIFDAVVSSFQHLVLQKDHLTQPLGFASFVAVALECIKYYTI